MYHKGLQVLNINSLSLNYS